MASNTRIIDVSGDLWSRLKQMLGAMSQSRDPLHVIWSPNDPACMAKFETLFDPASLPPWVTVGSVATEGMNTDCMSTGSMTGIGEGLIQQTLIHQVQSWLTYFRALRPVVEMPNIAVGIHVGVDMNKAPLSSCIKAMDAAIDTNPSTTFLVATQSETYKRELEGRYRGHVWFPTTGVSRMTQRGMNESIMEFLALSRCSKILAVRGSALSEMAASYGNVRLELIA